MLNWNGNINLANILMALYQVWGSSAFVEKIDIHNAPFSMMTIDVRIYARDPKWLRLEYDRSHLVIYVKCEEGYVYLGKLTPLPKIRGFDSCKMENLLTEFKAAAKYFEQYSVSNRDY